MTSLPSVNSSSHTFEERHNLGGADVISETQCHGRRVLIDDAEATDNLSFSDYEDSDVIITHTVTPASNVITIVPMESESFDNSLEDYPQDFKVERKYTQNTVPVETGDARLFDWLTASVHDGANLSSTNCIRTAHRSVGDTVPSYPGGLLHVREAAAAAVRGANEIVRVSDANTSPVSLAVSQGRPGLSTEPAANSQLSASYCVDPVRRRGLLPTPPLEMMLDTAVFDRGGVVGEATPGWSVGARLTTSRIHDPAAQDFGFRQGTNDSRCAELSRCDAIKSPTMNRQSMKTTIADDLHSARSLAELSRTMQSVTSYLLDAEQRGRLETHSSPLKPVLDCSTMGGSCIRSPPTSFQPQSDVILRAPAVFLQSAAVASGSCSPLNPGQQPTAVADELRRQSPYRSVAPKYVNSHGNTVFPPARQTADAVDQQRRLPADDDIRRQPPFPRPVRYRSNSGDRESPRLPPAMSPSSAAGSKVGYQRHHPGRMVTSGRWRQPIYRRNRHDDDLAGDADTDRAYDGDAGRRDADWNRLPPPNDMRKLRDDCGSGGEVEEEDWPHRDEDARSSSTSRRGLIFYADNHHYKEELRWTDEEETPPVDGPRWSNYKNRNKPPTANFVAMSKPRLLEIKQRNRALAKALLDRPRRRPDSGGGGGGGGSDDFRQSKRSRRTSTDRISITSPSSISSSSITGRDRKRRKYGADERVERAASSASRSGQRPQAADARSNDSRGRGLDRSSVDAASMTSSRDGSGRDCDRTSVGSSYGRDRSREHGRGDCLDRTRRSSREKRDLTSGNVPSKRNSSGKPRRDEPRKSSHNEYVKQVGKSDSRRLGSGDAVRSHNSRGRVTSPLSGSHYATGSNNSRGRLSRQITSMNGSERSGSESPMSTEHGAKARESARHRVSKKSAKRRRRSSCASSDEDAPKKASRKALRKSKSDDKKVSSHAKKRKSRITVDEDEHSPPDNSRNVEKLPQDGAIGLKIVSDSYGSPVGSDWSDTDDIPGDSDDNVISKPVYEQSSVRAN